MDTNNYLVSLSRQRAIRLMLATLCCLVFATLTQAQDFTVPGISGSNWVNTGLDIAPGTLLQMSATGQVFVGGRWDLQGPDGTPDCGPGAGFPGGRHRCYGLIARLTQSRTDHEDQLREDWAYGDSPQHCAEQGGHLWLTVNDDYVRDNDRAFMVHLTQVLCPARFRITINGFKVLHQSLDDALQRDGRGDEVFFLSQTRMIDNGTSVNSPLLRSRVMGDTNGHLGRVAAGSGRPTLFSPGIPGGLLTNDNFPDDPSVLSGRRTGDPIPFLIFEGPLTPSQVLVVIPTIWEQDQDGPDDLLTAIGRIFNPILDPAAGARSAAPLGVPEHPGLLGRILATAPATDPEFGTVKRGIFGDPHNRPIGMARENDLYSFSPQRLRFTLADAIAATRTRFNGYGPGVIPIIYKDASALEGHYLIFVQIQRL